MKRSFKKPLAILFTTIVLISGIGILTVPQKALAQTLQSTNPNPDGTCPDGFPNKQNTPSGIACVSGTAEQDAAAESTREGSNKKSCSWLDSLVCSAANFISEALLRIISLVLALAGLLFNFVLDETIVNMAQKINDPANLGGSINNAWATLRDLANIVFIFILLWAAIQTILELNTQNFGKTIKNIIIIALLINFSLFFGKVVIDASNIATIGFYNSIFQSAGKSSVGIEYTENSTAVKVGDFSGIILNALGIQSTFGKSALDKVDGGPMNILVVGVMGSITMLVLSVVLIVATVLFVARFILLIFLLILSPLAFIGYTIPALSSHFKNWWNQLINQAFFAPYFMLLMWVAIKLIYSPGFVKMRTGGEFSAIASNPQSTVGLFLNFILVMGFIVGALILSKNLASKTAGFKAISGGVGAVAIGGTAMAGRQTVGRYANAKFNDPELRRKAAEGDMGARMKLATAEKFAGSSFDVRGIGQSGFGKAIGADKVLGDIGKTGGKGGFKKSIEEKEKNLAKIAKERYGQTDEEKDKASILEEELKKQKEAEKPEVLKKREENLKTAEARVNIDKDETERYINQRLKPEVDSIKSLEEEKERKQKELEEEKKLRGNSAISVTQKQNDLKTLDGKLAKEKELFENAKANLADKDKDYKSRIERLKEATATLNEANRKIKLGKNKIEDTEYSQAIQNKNKEVDKLKNEGKQRQRSYSERIERGPLGISFIGQMQGNKAAARKIRNQIKEKSGKEKAADALKALGKEDESIGGEDKEPKEEKEGGGSEEGEKKES